MPLLGPFGLLFFVGLALFFAGNAVVWSLLGRYGGLDRSRTLFVVFDPDSPMKAPSARTDRRRFRFGVYTVGFGLLTFYTALSVGDARELRVCVDQCHRAGYAGGRFGPSTKPGSPTPAPRACFCVTPAGSVELP